jgi:carbon monoxide dehydrogenase subunit G
MKKILITVTVVLAVVIVLYQMGGSMTTFHHEIRTSAPPDTVWAILTNLEEVARYNPTVAHAVYIEDRNEKPHTARQCTLKDGSTVKERVVAASPGRSITMELYESSWPVDHMQWTTEIVAVDGGTLIKQDTRYEPRGIVGRLLNAVVMKRKMQSTITEVLTELGKYAEKR